MVYRILSFLLLVIILIIAGALWRMMIFQRDAFFDKRELYDYILHQQRREVVKAQQAAERAAIQSRQPAIELFQKLSDLMRNEQPYTDETLNRETLANMLGTNHRYVDEAIRACSDSHSTNAFINKFRVEHAARLLAESEEPITIISEMSGFSNRTSFNNLFREQYKMTPSQFRNASKAADKAF